MTADLFKEIYGSSPEVIAHAPGRLEVLGNHTDYNEGYVLSMAVNFGTEIAFQKIEGSECQVYSSIIGDGIRSFDLNEISRPLEEGDWTNYVRGLVVEFQRRNLHLGAFKALINSNMPLSAGMSSSASMEMALICGLTELFDLDISLHGKAQIGQACENNYIGAKTGLLDQLSSLSGRKDKLIFSEYRDLRVKHSPLPSNVSFVVLNSGVKHDLSCEYNERRESCEEAADILKTVDPKIRALRDVSTEFLEENKGLLSETVYKRALHITEENKRVLKAQDLLNDNKLEEFGQVLFDSHRSSINNFENSCPELDFLVETAKKSGICLGARLSGGGFGGISIHLVEKEHTEAYLNLIKSAFEAKYQKAPQAYICVSSDGAKAKKSSYRF